MAATIGTDKPFRVNDDTGFAIMLPNRKRVGLKVVDDPGESDKEPFPLPDGVPIEGWPVVYATHPEMTVTTM